MPARIRLDILVVDRSPLAHNLYQLLFAGQSRYRIGFADEFYSLAKRSQRFRPDILLVNSNAIPRDSLNNFRFPCPTILITSPSRVDLIEAVSGQKNVVVIKKPFYPYDLLSLASRLTSQRIEKERQKVRKQKSVKKRKRA